MLQLLPNGLLIWKLRHLPRVWVTGIFFSTNNKVVFVIPFSEIKKGTLYKKLKSDTTYYHHIGNPIKFKHF